jgi:hypothetical protein
MVQASLTILRAHHLHRDETPKIISWGGYGRWSQAIRGAVVWLGLDDPAEPRRETVEDDPDQGVGIVLLTALEQAYGSQPFLMSRALELSDTDLALEQAFRGVAERDGHIDKRAVAGGRGAGRAELPTASVCVKPRKTTVSCVGKLRLTETVSRGGDHERNKTYRTTRWKLQYARPDEIPAEGISSGHRRA